MSRASAFEVVDVRFRALDLALREPFGIATGVQAAVSNALVEVTLASGAVGLGEAAPFPAVSGETQASSLAALGRLAPQVRGSALAWRDIASAMAEHEPAQAAARAAIEQALVDALCRTLGVSIAQYFGASGASLVTDMTLTTGSVEEARAAALRHSAAGFTTLKLKVGGGDPTADALRAAAVAEAALGARLICDANGGFEAEQAIAFARALEDRGVDLALFEQPCARGDVTGLTRVARSIAAPVCADESARSAADVVALVREGAVRAINVKITKSGVAESLAMIAVARAAGLSLMIGGMVESEIAMTFSAQLASGLGGRWEVDLDTPLFLAEHPTREGYRCEGPRLLVDIEGTGLGLSLR